MTARIIPFPKCPQPPSEHRPNWDNTAPAPRRPNYDPNCEICDGYGWTIRDENPEILDGCPSCNPPADPSGESRCLSLEEVRAILAPARAAIEQARRRSPP
jgi:hypothetical protein